MLLRPLDRQSRLERHIRQLDARIAVLDASLDDLVAGNAAADRTRSRIHELAIARQRAQAQLDRLQLSVPGWTFMVPTTWW